MALRQLEGELLSLADRLARSDALRIPRSLCGVQVGFGLLAAGEHALHLDGLLARGVLLFLDRPRAQGQSQPGIRPLHLVHLPHHAGELGALLVKLRLQRPASCFIHGRSSSCLLPSLYQLSIALAIPPCRLYSPGESLKGAEAPFMEIRSGDMRGARSGCKPLPLSFGVCPKGAREMMFSVTSPPQRCEADLRRLYTNSSFIHRSTDRPASRPRQTAMPMDTPISGVK